MVMTFSCIGAKHSAVHTTPTAASTTQKLEPDRD